MANRFETIKRLNDQLVIFDLDGCIHDDEWRLPMIKSEGDSRFDEYHANLSHDAPLLAGKAQLTLHINAGQAIVFITARPNNVRVRTLDHIRELHGSDFDMCLFMRGDDEEGISAVQLKKEMLRKCLKNKLPDQQIIAAYDDRPDIIKMYLDHGISGARILDKNGLRHYNEYENFSAPAYEKPAPKPSVDIRAVDFGSAEFSTDPLAESKLGFMNDSITAADVLAAAALTFRERNAVYKDNANNVGNAMAALFPEGVQIKTAADHKMYHLFELIIVKLTRFANSGLTHRDSIHDAAVYAAMCEVLANTHNINTEGK